MVFQGEALPPPFFAFFLKRYYIIVMKLKFIDSIHNPSIKWIKKVCQNPKKEGYVVFEGEHILEEALKSDFYFHRIVMTEEKYKKWKEMVLGFETLIVKEELLKAISLTKSPEGVLAVGMMKKWVLEEPRENSAYLYMDGVQDPVNVGILIRSAYAFGFDAVFFGEGSCDFFNPTVVARSAGAVFHIPVYSLKKVEFLSWAELNRVGIFVADSSKGGDIRTFFPFSSFVLVLGNEARGISKEILEKNDKVFTITMRDGWDSLNVAAAGSILMYELKKLKM